MSTSVIIALMVRSAVQLVSQPKTNMYVKLKGKLGSRTFFYFIVALFVLQAGWIAIRSSYPLAFDEGYHLGIIQLYSHQWSPFFAHLPDSTGQFGALATDPSYLYHYLLSFPYRAIALFTHNVFVIVLTLRFISIAFFAAGIILFRKVLAYTQASSALINIVLLIFALLPLESFTAAQINYDTLLFPITGATLLLTLRFLEVLKKNQFDSRAFAGLIVTCLMGAQVKYVFLPIMATVLIFVAYVLLRWWLANKRQAWGIVKKGIGKLSFVSKVILISMVILSGGLFTARYGYNLATYRSPVPNCERVLSVEACSNYGTWLRDYQLSRNHIQDASWRHPHLIGFMVTWTHIMGDELLTVLNVATGGAMEKPVRQFVYTAAFITLCGIPLMLLQARQLFKQIGFPLILFVAVSITYLGSLWYKNYTDFIKLGIPVAVQGRYLLPVLLLLMVIGAQAYSMALRRTPELKVYLLIIALAMSTQGGGLTTYLLRTNATWYWDGTASAEVRFPVAEPVTNSRG